MSSIWDYQCFIFDMDGTLIDSMGVWAEVDAAFLKARNLAFDTEYLQNVRNMHLDEAAIYTQQYYGLTDSLDEIREFWIQGALRCYRESVQLKAGVAEFLEAASRSGKEMLVCTASGRDFVEAVLPRHKIMQHFRAIVSAPELGESKLDQRIWHHCASIAEVSPADCLVFEDNPSPLKAALETGMQVVSLEDPSNFDDREELCRLGLGLYPDFYAMLPDHANSHSLHGE